MYRISEVMERMAEEVMSENPEKFRALTESDIRIRYLVCDKGKTANGKIIYGECSKQPEKQTVLSECDFVITFYADGAVLPPDKMKILMEHELMHAGVKEDGSTYIIPHDIEDFADILEKYGVRWTES